MKREIELVKEPKELAKWMTENDVLFDMSLEDLEILLGYLEGHDYAVGTEKEKLFRIDLAQEGTAAAEYSMDDLIDQVCEWNYELIQQTEEKLEKADIHDDTGNLEQCLVSYKKDEERLDRMFEQTTYGKKINEIAQKTICVVIEKMELGKDEIAAAVVDSVKQYRTEMGR